MRDVAAWLVARPQNAIPVLSISVLIPLLQPIGGAVLVLLVLVQGTRRAATTAIIAGAIAGLGLLLAGGSAQAIVLLLVTNWLPLFALAALMIAVRSYAMTVQISVVVAVLIAMGFGLIVTDSVAFWQPTFDRLMVVLADVQGSTIAEQVPKLTPEYADVLAPLVIFGVWLLILLILSAGYWLGGLQNEESLPFGRIRDLNFGRVLASGLLLMIVLSAITGLNVFDRAAIVLMMSLILQGWSLMYWLFAKNQWPTGAFFAVAIVSALVGFMSAFVMVLGYLDAWFDFRRRWKQKV